jgi:hypothetical protein
LSNDRAVDGLAEDEHGAAAVGGRALGMSPAREAQDAASTRGVTSMPASDVGNGATPEEMHAQIDQADEITPGGVHVSSTATPVIATPVMPLSPVSKRPVIDSIVSHVAQKGAEHKGKPEQNGAACKE